MPCRILWKKKLLKLKPHWMKRRRRVKKQKEDLPSNDSNSLTLTLYDYPQCLPKKEENYIGEFLHGTTESYYERGKYGCLNFHVIKTPLFLLKVLKLLLSYLPMIVSLCFLNLF